MFELQNNKLKIKVLKAGAELCSISGLTHNTEFMWNADPKVWASFAPNLFPIIGSLKNGQYMYNSTFYSLPKHGLVRNNNAVQLQEKTDNSLVFKLESNPDTYKLYPFNFKLLLTYTLNDNTIEIAHTIKNNDTKTMYFSVGGHPAFKCPVFKNENYNDYCLEFEHIENANSYMLNPENGLMTSRTKPVLNTSTVLPLTHSLFNDDALVFKDLKSKKITLKSKVNGPILSVEFNDFPYLGIWAKPNGNFVCIEPWLGIGDHEETNQNLITKEGIIPLHGHNTYKISYKIAIDNAHLM